MSEGFLQSTSHAFGSVSAIYFTGMHVENGPYKQNELTNKMLLLLTSPVVSSPVVHSQNAVIAGKSLWESSMDQLGDNSTVFWNGEFSCRTLFLVQDKDVFHETFVSLWKSITQVERNMTRMGWTEVQLNLDHLKHYTQTM
jgi:hypothetical protein